MSDKIFGSSLRIGDTIKIWFKPYRVTVTSLDTHPDPNGVFNGDARLAKFGQTDLGMTIEPNARFELLHRPAG